MFIDAKYGKCNTKDDYKSMRQKLKDYGIDKFKNEMEKLGIINTGKITSELKPFNPFARIIAGKMENPCKDTIINSDEFILFRNRPENDEHWHDSSPEWIGKASMSENHKFLSILDDNWSTFNVLTFVCDNNVDHKDYDNIIFLLNQMEYIAIDYTKKHNWSENIGLYFHCLPFNSIYTLHLHIVDLDKVGPTFNHLNYKNLSLNDVREVLCEEATNL